MPNLSGRCGERVDGARGHVHGPTGAFQLLAPCLLAVCRPPASQRVSISSHLRPRVAPLPACSGASLTRRWDRTTTILEVPEARRSRSLAMRVLENRRCEEG